MINGVHDDERYTTPTTADNDNDSTRVEGRGSRVETYTVPQYIKYFLKIELLPLLYKSSHTRVSDYIIISYMLSLTY